MDYATLSARTVADAMHEGVITCVPETPLREVARLMARFGVHAIVVFDPEPAEAGGVWGVISDADLVAAIDRGDMDGLTAAGGARTPLLTVRREEPLRRAARLMRANGVAHAVVVDRAAGRPVGIVSSLDLARAVAAEPEPS